MTVLHATQQNLGFVKNRVSSGVGVAMMRGHPCLVRPNNGTRLAFRAPGRRSRDWPSSWLSHPYNHVTMRSLLSLLTYVRFVSASFHHQLLCTVSRR